MGAAAPEVVEQLATLQRALEAAGKSKEEIAQIMAREGPICWILVYRGGVRYIGPKVQCTFCFVICTPEGRG